MIFKIEWKVLLITICKYAEYYVIYAWFYYGSYIITVIALPIEFNIEFIITLRKKF